MRSLDNLASALPIVEQKNAETLPFRPIGSLLTRRIAVGTIAKRV
jgi:hypothetical protein